MALLAAPVTGDALAPYRGQPVLSVEVQAPPDEDPAVLREVIGIEPGYLLATDDVAAALKRLYALGRFSNVSVSAQRRHGTVILYFSLRPVRRLSSLDIDGARELDVDALRATLRLRVGDEVDSRTRDRIEARSTEYLRAAGFPDAKVEVSAIARQGDVVSYVLRVQEGEPIRVAAVLFLGQPRAPPDVLRRVVKTRQGGILDRTLLSGDAQRLLDAYRHRGFFAADVQGPHVDVEGRQATVRFTVTAGDRMRIEVRGSSLLTSEDLLAIWPTPVALLTDTDIKLFADRVAGQLRRLGYHEARVWTDSVRDVPHETTVHRLTIAEGPLFRVVEVAFPGAHALDSDLLIDQVHAVLVRNLQADALFRRLSETDRCLVDERHLPRASLGDGCPNVDVRPEYRWVPDIYAEALDEITAAYRNRGFLSARVGPAEPRIEETQTGSGRMRRVHVRVPVEEGTQTFVTSITLHGNQAYTAGELLGEVETVTSAEDPRFALRPGAPFSAAGVEDGRIAIVRMYRDLGYLYANVFSEVHLSEDRKQAEVEYRCEEGPQVRIQRVLVRGNRYTRENVIRSRMTLKPDDLYRLEEAVEDQRSILALGVFSSVRVKLIDEEKPAEQKDLVAEVVERNRQGGSMGIGISSADGPRFSLTHSHINVFGAALAVTASIKVNRQVFFDLYDTYADTMRQRYNNFVFWDQIEREVRIGGRLPRRSWAVRADVVHERDNVIPYSLESYSIIGGLDFTPTRVLTLALEPKGSRTSLECADAKAVCFDRLHSDRPGRRLIEIGLRNTFEVGPSVTLDLRDDQFNPTRGLIANVRAVYAVGTTQADRQVPLTEPFSFTKIEGTVSGYIPGGGMVLALSARGGQIEPLRGNLPIDERFYLGGRATLRGFVEGALVGEGACLEGEVTPNCRELIKSTSDGVPLTAGGNFFVLFKSEVRLPLRESLSLGVFVDAGNLWVATPAADDLRLRVGTGLGLRYVTPVGPLALDFGFNTAPRAKFAEPASQLHFSVGVF